MAPAGEGLGDAADPARTAMRGQLCPAAFVQARADGRVRAGALKRTIKMTDGNGRTGRARRRYRAALAAPRAGVARQAFGERTRSRQAHRGRDEPR
jgi:hypothetical protein